VFAMWTARAGADLCGIEQALEKARDAGVAALPQIAEREAPLLGLTQPECLAYLRDATLSRAARASGSRCSPARRCNLPAGSRRR
jgi:hypothetical protein